jgi:flagellar biosynthesis protein FlhB
VLHLRLFDFITHDSQEYVRIGLYIVLYTATFVLLDISECRTTFKNEIIKVSKPEVRKEFNVLK